jgi:hypothetical protein
VSTCLVAATSRSTVCFRIPIHPIRAGAESLESGLLYRRLERRDGSLAVNHVLSRTERELASFFASYDLRLTPVLGEPPDRIGSFGDSWSFDRIQEHLYRYVAYTPIATTTGLAGNVGAYSVDRQALARRPGTSAWADYSVCCRRKVHGGRTRCCSRQSNSHTA